MMELQPGTQIGNYRIERSLGHGGMGVVYVAEHIGLGRKAALKLMAPDLADQASLRERFVRESRSAAAIDHPNIVPLYEAGEFQGQLYLAMRYVEGTDLKQLLRGEGALTPERALSIVGQVADALDAAHARGLVHRDVKPGNVLIDPGSDHAYLTDFGLTKSFASASGVTQPGQFVGTIDYVAPEQIQGGPLDGRTDVYSLACMLHECITGRVPYERDTDIAVLWAKINEPPPRLSEVRPDLPAALDGALVTGMAREKDQRYPTCAALVAAARSAVEPGATPSVTHARAPAQPVAARPVPAPAAPAGPAAPGPTRYDRTAGDWSEPLGQTAATETLPPPRRRRGLVPALVLAALLLAGGGTAAALILTGKDEGGGSESPSGGEPAGQRETPPAGDTGPAPPGGELSPGRDDERAVEAAIERHWRLREQGRFEDAYATFAPGRAPPRGEFIAGGEADAPLDATVDVRTNFVEGDTAEAQVLELTTRDNSGCKTWSGTYDMERIGSRWLISRANIEPSACGG